MPNYDYKITVNTDLVPPAVTVIPMVTTPPTTPTPTGTYKVLSSGILVDPNGAEVVIRGIEQTFWHASWLPLSFITEMGKTYANTVRVLLKYQESTPTGEPALNLAEIENAIKLAINAKMLVDVAIDGGHNPAIYLNTEVKALLRRYEKYIVIHAKGEATETTDDSWANSAKSVIASMRSAGYICPLYIMSREYGRNLPCLLNKATEVLASDPLRNVVFGWQAYWGSGGYYQNKYGLSLSQALDRVSQIRSSGVMIQIGVLYHSDSQAGYGGQTVDYNLILDKARTLKLSWLWWDWRMSEDDCTTDGIFGHWAHQGQDVCITNFGSIKNTSIRTPFQLAQSV